MDEKRKGFIGGFSVACAELANTHGEPDLAAFLLRDAGITQEEMRTAGVDDEDIATLVSACKNIGVSLAIDA